MTGWPDSELSPIRYVKIFQRPLLLRLPACPCAASLVAFFSLPSRCGAEAPAPRTEQALGSVLRLPAALG